MKSNLEITISDIKDSKIRTIPDQIYKWPEKKQIVLLLSL